MSDHIYPDDLAEVDRLTIQAALAEVTDQARQSLRSSVDALIASGRPAGEWVAVNGEWPYVTYSPEADALWSAINDAGLVVPFDWPAWSKTIDPNAMPHEDPVDAVRTITAVIRADRFNAGALLNAFESGLLVAAVRTLLDETPETAGSELTS